MKHNKKVVFYIALMSVLFLGGCYSYDLKITTEEAAVRTAASRGAGIRARLAKGTIVENIAKQQHWYYVKYPVHLRNGKTAHYNGYIYRDDVIRTHHFRNIYDFRYDDKDNLALMITLPAFFVILGLWLSSSRSKKFNLLIVFGLIWLILTQTVYVLAVDKAKSDRIHYKFKSIIPFIEQKLDEGSMFLYYTDITWAARIEVYTKFKTNFDRFAVRGDPYNRKARMTYLSASRDPASIHGAYILTDSWFYGRGTSWELPPSIVAGNYPPNWVLVRSSGTAKLFYAR